MKLCALFAGILTVAQLSVFAAPAAVPTTPETVILLHGLGRTGGSMWLLAHSLRRDGYHVIAPSYPWRTQSLPQLAGTWLPAQLTALAGAPRIHFVTHSMGGILVRAWLREQGAPANLGRTVMLAPPNAGSEIPDRLAGYAAFRWLVGGNGPLLGTAPDSLPRSLGPWPAEAGDLGIIAGNQPLPGLTNDWLPAPHDGKVSVASTHLAGERAHLVLPFSHTWLGWHRATAAQVKRFLRDGRFDAP